MKFLFVTIFGESASLAQELLKEGHQVKFFIKDRKMQDVSRRLVPRARNWKKYKDWADVICFDDVDYGKEIDNLRNRGYLVVGGNRFGDKLENDRLFAQKIMKEARMKIPPSRRFRSFRTAIEFIKKRPRRYVIKISGQPQRYTCYLGKTSDGFDLLKVVENLRDQWPKQKSIDFILQEWIDGIEMGSGAFFNGKDFVYPVNITFEHKNFLTGGIGPLTGEMGCYDEKTEVLTREGWKYFKNLTYKNKIATLNPNTNQLEYHRPSKIVVYSHHKKMIQIKNRSIDILVTPNHNMWVQKRRQKNWKFIRADSIPSNPPKIARTAEWKGKKYDINKAKFLGIYLAEGWVSKNPHSGYRVAIAGASNSKKFKKIQKMLDKTGLSWKRDKNSWYVYNKTLYEELVKYGKSYEKYIPPEIKNSDKKFIKAFLDAYGLGDATIMRGGWRIFYTSSKRMADDVQELLLKIGRVGIIKERNRFNKKIWIEDHWTSQKHNAFEIIERVKKIYSYLDKRDIKLKNYYGKVYCATVPFHIMYVRRNGKSYWCGNTSLYYSQDGGKLFKETLLKIKSYLAKTNYRGFIDLNCIVTQKGAYPIDFTSRFGYPQLDIMQELHKTSWGELLFKLAEGTLKRFEVYPKFAIGVVIGGAGMPYEISYNKYGKNLPILGINKENEEHVKLAQVCKRDGKLYTAGSGYVLVINGSGRTMEAAKKRAYEVVNQITIPNAVYRLDIGDHWKKEGPRLRSWGYANDV